MAQQQKIEPLSPDSDVAALFRPYTLRDVTLPNRLVMAPMCQYVASDGFADDWHLTHLGSRAAGGIGTVMVEATAVTAQGRISPGDVGIWKDEHIAPLARIASFIRSQGSVPAIQLAHAGRKASCAVPWKGGAPLVTAEGGWSVVGPSAVPFDDRSPVPEPLDEADIGLLLDAYEAAAARAVAAGFEIVEIHAAHGYLLHAFLSPLSNVRADDFGGSLSNRMRLALMVAERVRSVLPNTLSLWTRISATDWADTGWDVDQSVELSRQLAAVGVDLIDVSSGGTLPAAKIPVGPGFQVPFAERIKREANIATGAVGVITEPAQANAIVAENKADLVLLGRQLLRDPYWAHRARLELHAPGDWPTPYGYVVGRR